MPRIPCGMEATLEDALLADVDNQSIAAITHRQMRAAGLGEAVLPRECVGSVLRNPARAQPSAGFFVGEPHEGHCSLWRVACLRAPGCFARGCGLRRRDEEHVEYPAAVQNAVYHLGIEGIVSPFVHVNGDYVNVTEHRQWFRCGVAAGHCKRDRYAAGFWLEALHLGSRALEERLQQVRVAVLVATSGGSVVDATIAN